jgi:predicted O-methyltransferase YrrM
LPAVIQGEFDLVWIDGGHLYPEIAWDICNAYHRVRKGGFLMCDDIIVHPRGVRDAYVSPDAHQVLQYLVTRTSDHLELYLKRLGATWSSDPRARKYVALLNKTCG